MSTDFDLTGPLPTGLTVLEASAGTGKTYAIAGLAARWVAEGVPLEKILLVTFTRAATGELRDRVRERLTGAERALGRAATREDDDVIRVLREGSPEAVAARRAHLSRAAARFDGATITTIHGLCQEILAGLGVAGDEDPGATLLEDAGDLADQIAGDLYLRAWAGEGKPAFDPAVARQLARAVVAHPDADIRPDEPGGTSRGALRGRFALAIRRELELRKRRAGIVTYDDLVARLHASVAGNAAGVDRLRDRFEVVLVDEFQDTDRLQWEALSRAFGGAATLVLVGDPKQAIYAFRGADVHAYLAAASAAGSTRDLPVNWRSDEHLLRAFDALFGDARLGDPRIAYRHVEPSPEHRGGRLHGAPHPEALRVRVLDRTTVRVTGTTRQPQVDAVRERIAEDIAADVAALLGARPRVDDGGELEAGEIAVLTRRGKDAELVRDALTAAGVPAVFGGAQSVFLTDAARDWLRLLEALERPASESPARRVTRTAFFGWDGARIDAADEAAWDTVHDRLHGWSRVLRARGVAALAEAVFRGERIPGRVLREERGERRLTDLRHVAELLHAAERDDGLGAASLTAWLGRRIAQADREGGQEERTRRLDSDADAVQVMTVHASKGLEFGVVYVPFAWDRPWDPKENEPVVFHEGDRRVLDVRPSDAALAAAFEESRGEELRQLYVALTRARHQAVLWWAGVSKSEHSALGRLAFSRRADGSVPARGGDVIEDPSARERFAEIAQAAPGCVSVEDAVVAPLASVDVGSEVVGALSAARFDRELDRGWRRTSFSDITARTHEPGVGSEPEEERLDDEPAVAVVADGGAVSPLAGMPGGTEVGTVVHGVFEAVDFAADDLSGSLEVALDAATARRPVDLGDRAAVLSALRGVIETPLGPAVGDLRLRDLESADRLDELAFELPLAGGDAASGWVTPSLLASTLRSHATAGDPLLAYADRLADPSLRARVRGYLTGAIDLVFRVRGADGSPRYAIVDFKTNRLAPFDEPLLLEHHRPSALGPVMDRAHYGLQALLYAVALHRYLRWRLSSYDAERDLAGVLYLFVRGMAGAATPREDGVPYGVWTWRPPGALVVALSDALDAGVAG